MMRRLITALCLAVLVLSVTAVAMARPVPVRVMENGSQDPWAR